MDNSTGNKLETLFDLFIDQLLAEVKASVAEGLPIAAADKAAIIRFLQLNNMAYQPGNNDALETLRQQLLDKQAASNGSALAAIKAAEADLDALNDLYVGRLQ